MGLRTTKETTETKISYFDNVASSPKDVPMAGLLKAIKTGTFKDKIEKLRGMNEQDQEAYKKTLPSVTFGGTFHSRNMKGLKNASGLLVLDFDVEGYVCPEKLIPFSYAYFRSPRGGLKVLVRIPVVKSDSEFKSYFWALQKEVSDIDPSGKDVSRLCFVSYDPDLVVNEQAKIWDKTATGDKERKQQAAPLRSKPTAIHQQSNYSKITLILKMLKTMVIGNRHETCLKSGQLAGGYFATGELNDNDIDLFVREIEATSTDPNDHVKAFMDGVEYGKALPLHSSTRGKADVHKVRKAIKAEFEASEHIGDIFYSAKDQDIENEIWERWKTGFVRGVTTGWDCLDQLYSVMPGYMTILYGSPFQGKSLFGMNLLINLSKLHGWTHALFTPEMGTPSEVMTALIQIYCKGDMNQETISKEKMEEAIEFINNHFIILDNEESGDDLDMEALCLYVDLMERKFEKKIHTLTIDPIIELKMEGDIRDDLFWNRELKRGRVLSKSSDRHLFLIHHTRDMGKPDGKDDYGNPVYRQAGPNEIAYGQTFYRKAYFMINVWYHYCEQARLGDTVELKCIKKQIKVGYTYVKVVKAKPEGAGRRGEVALRYSGNEHAYYEDGYAVTDVEAVRDPSQPQIEQGQLELRPAWEDD